MLYDFSGLSFLYNKIVCYNFSITNNLEIKQKTMENNQGKEEKRQLSDGIVFFPEKEQKNTNPNVPNTPHFNGIIFGNSADSFHSEKESLIENNPEKKNIYLSEKTQIDLTPKIVGGNKKESVSLEKNNNFRKKIFSSNYVKWIIIPFILLIFILFSCVFGFSKYEQYYKKIAAEKLLPNNPNLVIEITIDPESKQFKLLEQNLEKFPGYETLQKKLDVYGEGKTFSQFFQNKIEKAGLDFQSDIKPVLGEKVYIVVPDAKPIGNNLKYNMLTALNEGGKTIAEIMANRASGKQILASEQPDENEKKSEVLGTEKKSDIKQLDYIITSEISNLKKAGEVMEKIKKDTEKYEYSELNFDGRPYYKIKIKNNTSVDIEKFINFQETYNALLGSNWVVSSNESFIKDAIKRQKQNLIVDSIFSDEDIFSLSDDKNFKKVNENFAQESKDNFMTLYYNINYDEIFHSDECSSDAAGCDNIAEYIKYPENIISGIGISFDSEGIAIKSASNQIAMEDFENQPFSESLVHKIPSQLAERWADVVIEDSNVKKLYYSFKKNNLTEKGAQEWNNVLGQIRDAIGIDFERDFIDVTDGNLAFIFLSKKNSNPEGVIVAEISDEQKMLESMKKIIEVIKAGLIAEYSDAASFSGDFSTIPNKKSYPSNPEILKEIKIYKQALSDVQKSQITETETPNGKIYSYEIIFPKTEFMLLPSFSINFSLEDKKLVLSSSYGAVESVLKANKDSSIEKISSGKNFQDVSRYFYPSLYQYSYANTLGIYNAFEYYSSSFKNTISSQSICTNGSMQDCNKYQEIQEEQLNKIDDVAFAAGAIFRTIKLIGSSNSVDEKFVKSNIYINIQELPKEEKDRANKIISNFNH